MAGAFYTGLARVYPTDDAGAPTLFLVGVTSHFSRGLSVYFPFNSDSQDKTFGKEEASSVIQIGPVKTIQKHQEHQKGGRWFNVKNQGLWKKRHAKEQKTTLKFQTESRILFKILGGWGFSVSFVVFGRIRPWGKEASASLTKKKQKGRKNRRRRREEPWSEASSVKRSGH